MDSNKEYGSDHHWNGGYSAAVALIAGNSPTASSSNHATSQGSIMPQQQLDHSMPSFDAGRLPGLDHLSLQQQQRVPISRALGDGASRYNDQGQYNFLLGKNLHATTSASAPYSQAHQQYGFPFLEPSAQFQNANVVVQGDHCDASSMQTLYGLQSRGSSLGTGQLHGGVPAAGNRVSSQSTSSMKPPKPRSYTKVLKLGSIGRSLNIASFRNYVELRIELAKMFGLEGQLDQNSNWQLVYMDNEGDILLVGDDRWEEFVSSVRGIRIMSPSEVAIYTSEEYAGTPLSTCLTKTQMP